MKKSLFLLALVLFVSCSGENGIINPVIDKIGNPTSKTETKKGGGQYIWKNLELKKLDTLRLTIDKVIGSTAINLEKSDFYKTECYIWETKEEKVYLESGKSNIETGDENSYVMLTVIEKK